MYKCQKMDVKNSEIQFEIGRKWMFKYHYQAFKHFVGQFSGIFSFRPKENFLTFLTQYGPLGENDRKWVKMSENFFFGEVKIFRIFKITLFLIEMFSHFHIHFLTFSRVDPFSDIFTLNR